jgi:myo-inositol-1(or 4)-monophosphatase
MDNEIEFVDVLSTLDRIKVDICQYIDWKMNELKSLEIEIKADKTPVTEIDIYISDLIKMSFQKLYPFLNFYSEEDPESFKYPLIILDPIDGTRELSRGIGECAVSFGIYYSGDLTDKRNFSWIFNPFNSFSVDSYNLPLKSKKSLRKELLSFVSQTEYEKGLYDFKDSLESKHLNFLAKGSIAYKLALLSRGICDFVITKKPKNIWDIMAGSHICHLLGMKMIVNGVETSKLDNLLIESPIVWFHNEHREQLKFLFQK